MNKNKDFWSRFASDFEQHADYVVGKSDIELILNKTASLHDLGNTLELGCGVGTYSRVLSQLADSLIATDISDQMIEKSKSNLKSYENIKVEKADCFELAYADNSFNSVFMANLLHVIRNPNDALQECKRVLKPNGLLVVVSYTTDGMKVLSKLGMIYRYLRTWGKPPKEGTTLGLKEACDLITSSGFDIAESTLVGEKSKALFIRANALSA